VHLLWRGVANAVVLSSVPDEYLPPGPCRLLPRLDECFGLDALAGKIRGGAWNLNHVSPVCWS
jgi:hypothetical protein